MTNESGSFPVSLGLFPELSTLLSFSRNVTDFRQEVGSQMSRCHFQVTRLETLCKQTRLGLHAVVCNRRRVHIVPGSSLVSSSRLFTVEIGIQHFF